jgi:hypothetical protein
MFEIRFPDRGDDESENGASRKKPRGSNRTRARRRAAHKPDFHKLAFEPLEPRVVFSASPFDSENFHASDTTAPQVLSLVGNSPNSPTNASSLVYTLTFSEAVTGVDTTDFAFIASAGVTANSTFVVSAVSTSVYTITVSGITGNGTLRLDLRDDGSIRDLAGNQLPSDIVQQSIGVGATPYGLALGDLNGDGKIDIVTEGGPTNTVAVMLGNGDGTFGAQQTFGLGLAVPPITFAIGDVDGDGKADILSTGANRATVLLGNGDGTFQVPRESGLLDWEPKNVSFGDFNADGKLDFVFAARYGSVQVAFGNGNGTFANPQQQSAPDSEAARGLDVDGDGKLDIVSVSQPNGLVSVLLGNGNGTFKPQQTYAARLGSQAFTAGDFNGDGKLDLATSNDFDGSLSVLLGNGNGTFQTQRSIVAGVEPMSIRASDFNGDGRVDLAFVNTTDAGPGTLKILLGNGDGTFFNPQTMPTGVRTFRLETGDFNGDGKSDIVVANVQDGTLGINLNVARPVYTGQTYTIDRTAPSLVSYVRNGNTATNGSSVSYTQTFNEAVTGVTPAQFFAVTTGTVAYGAIVVTPESGSVYTITVNDIVGDGTIALSFFDGVGVQDLAGNRLATESLTTQLRPESRITVFSDTRSATIADFNADGKLDIVSAHSSGRISVLLGNGDDTFQTFRTFTSIATADLVSGDFNADGKVDIAFRNNNSGIGVMLGVGDGTFQAQQTLTVGTTNYALTSGDFNNDGKLDLAVVGLTNSLFLLRGNGNGTFLAPQTTTLAGFANEVLAGDIDNDGKLDLVVNNGTNLSMYFLGGNGNGTFKAGQSIASGYQMPVLGDLNADGKLDLVLTTSALGTVRVHLGNGNGTFQALSTYAVGSMYANVIGDINGDGKADLVVARSPAGFSVLLGNGDGTLQAARTFAGVPPYYNNENVKLADLNGDGRPDLINPNRYGNTVSVWLNGAGATGQSFTIDHSGPALQSIARTGAAVTNSPTVSYTVTFAETVTGVGAADFVVATTGGLVASAITVTPVSGSVYTVTFGVGSGDGTATLKLVDNGSIFDLVGNSLAALQAPATVGISGSLVNSILSGDFNGDGRDDLLLASGNSFVLRLSAGPDGSFLAPTTISPGVSFGSPIAIDVNADGKLDLLFESDSLQMNVYAMLGNGNGTFKALDTYAIGELTSNLAAGDVTGDGIVDIVTGLGTTIKVFQGNGNGTFKANQTLIGVGGSGFLALRDLNGDGRLDIISSATSSSTTLNVLMAVDNPFNPGTTIFQTPRTIALAYPITGLATGDFDGDGKLDLAISNKSATSLTAHLYLGNGDGTFATPLTLGVGANTFGILSGDFDADGELDLAVLDRDDGTISMLYGNGDATFRYRQTMYVGGLGATALGAGDFSGDGTPDLAVKGFSSAFYLLSLSAGGTFVGPTYTVDQTVPTLVSIERSNPTAAITNASTVTFTITFSEAVTGFDATDYFLNITFSTTYSSVTTTQVSASVYTVTVGGIVGYTSFSTLGITLNFDGTIKDAAGNTLDNSVGVRTLLPYQSVAIDARSRAMATADFNGDGKLDLVSVDGLPTNVIAIALGNGDGTFKASQTFATQSQSSGLMVVGDVDGDGKLDLVTMHTTATRGGVLLGNGNGTFKAQTTFTVGTTTNGSSNSRVLALGDVNSDGKLDLLVANPGSGMVTVSLGNGNGTFQTQQSISLPNLLSVALADVNGDGKLDLLATTSNNRLALQLGNGNGTFQSQQTFVTSFTPYFTVADVNADGKLDVVGLPDWSGITGSFLAGNGDGTFQAQKTFSTSGATNTGVLVGDVTGDGKPDVVALSYGISINVLAGNGDGTFKARQSFGVAASARPGVLGDFNADGKLDVAVGSTGATEIDILFGGPTFAGPTYTIDQIDPSLVSIVRTTPSGPTTTATTVEYTVTFNESVTGVDASDFQLALSGTAVANPLVVTALSGTDYKVTVSGISGDGTLGLNLANNGTITDEAGNRLWLLQRMPTVASTFGPVSAVVRGDLNADGNVDLVYEYNSSSLGVSLGNGDGTFQTRQTFSFTGDPTSLALDDLNADGKLDLVVSNGTDSAFSVLFGNGNGTFQARQTFTGVAGAKLLALRDLNGDGKLDLSFLVPSASAVGIFLGNGDGTFQAVQSFSTVATPKSLVLADVDADGKTDFLVGSDFNDNAVSLFLGNGDGTFQARRSFAVGAGAKFVAAGDIDGDGKVDLTVTNSWDHTASLLLGNGDGTFRTQQTIATGRMPYSVMLGDVTGDGKIDLVTGNYGNGTVGVLAGNGNGTFQASRDGALNAVGSGGMTLGDLNGDGLLDLSGSGSVNAVNAILGVRNSTFIGQTYTIDGRPTVVGIARTNPAGSSTNASTVQFTVTFSEAVTGVSLADFDLAVTGDVVGSITQVVASSGSVYVVTVSGITGLGTLALKLVDDGSIRDTTNNLLLLAEPSFTGPAYAFDPPGPKVVSFTQNSPATTGAQAVSYTVTFDGTVTGVDAGDFVITDLLYNSFDILSVVVVPVSGSVYTVSIDGIISDGTVKLNLIDDGTIRGTAGQRIDVSNFGAGYTSQPLSGYSGILPVFADFTSDGIVDRIDADGGLGGVTLSLGIGGFQFMPVTSLGIANPTGMKTEDFNSDGQADLYLNFGSSTQILLGNGDGTFHSAFTYDFGTSLSSFEAADIDGDGKLDLALSSGLGRKVEVLLGNGDGTFLAPLQSISESAEAMAIGDLNGDGKLDIVVSGDDRNLTTLLGNGDGMFHAGPVRTVTDVVKKLTLGDIDGDHKLDLIGSSFFSQVGFFGAGDGSFTTPFDTKLIIGSYDSVLADFDGDGHADWLFATATGGIGVLPGTPTGLGELIVADIQPNTKDLITADLGGDGRLDIVAVQSYGGVNSAVALINRPQFAAPWYMVDTVAPIVRGIYARGVGSGSANWNASFLSYLATNGMGDASLGYRLSTGGTQLRTLPWSNVNTISIEFSEPMVIAQDDLTVIGAANGPAVPVVTGFTWDSGRNVATWTFDVALSRGKFLLHLGSAVRDVPGNALDGEWTVSSSTSSGNGTAGGDFNFRFNVLPGDFDGNNGVTITEVLAARNRAGKGTASVGYAYREDIDGNGNITITEVLQSRNRTATSITGLNEPVAPGSTPQSPLEIAPLVPGEEDGLYVSPYAALTEAELAPIVDEAIARWEASGLVPQDFDWSKLRFAITDLGPAYLGLGNPDGAILLDDDGAGWGWFVDGSPSEDGEFASSNTDAAAVAHMDLLTVVMHEIGHALGYPTGSAQDTPAAALMSEFLGVGAHRTPGVAPAVSHHEPDLAPADLLAAGSFASAGAGPSLTNWSAAVAPSSQDYAIYALSSFTADNSANSSQPDESAKLRANKSRRWP